LWLTIQIPSMSLIVMGHCRWITALGSAREMAVGGIQMVGTVKLLTRFDLEVSE
jgi:hypothetical protein